MKISVEFPNGLGENEGEREIVRPSHSLSFSFKFPTKTTVAEAASGQSLTHPEIFGFVTVVCLMDTDMKHIVRVQIFLPAGWFIKLMTGRKNSLEKRAEMCENLHTVWGGNLFCRFVKLSM